MYYFNNVTHGSFAGSLQFGLAPAMLDSDGHADLGPAGKPATTGPVAAHIVGDEAGWRLPPVLSKASSPRISTTRWASSERRTRESYAETAGDGYVIGLVLRPMDIQLSVSGRVVQNGVAAPGMVHVSEPSASAHCLFRGSYDALHLHVPNDLLLECGSRSSTANAGLLRSEPAPQRDPVTLQLGLALLKAEECGASFGWIYADGLSLAIVSRLLALQARGQSRSGRTEVVALAKWRLKRAIDYINAHLDEAVSLADVAAAAGLSRMHFAAQFKAATGYRPHDYLLRRRISRAQDIMLASALPLVEVALQVGFQSQAHFTTVFKRLVGQPPHAWRQSGASAKRLSC